MTPESGYSDGSLIYSVVLALNIVQGLYESSKLKTTLRF